jgi:hypothetical protein
MSGLLCLCSGVLHIAEERRYDWSANLSDSAQPGRTIGGSILFLAGDCLARKKELLQSFASSRAMLKGH